MRQVVATLGLFLALGLPAQAQPKPLVTPATPDQFRVTLLGTGSPTLDIDRSGPATLVEVGGQKLLFDAGRNVPVRLQQAGVPPAQVTALFITHYHSDHVSGVPDLWLTAWLPGGGGRKDPFRVIGPTGAKALMDNLRLAYADDVRIRIEDQQLIPSGGENQTTEFSKDGVVYEKDGVEVVAFAVDHGEKIKPAYGYRINYKGKSVLISGDTRFSENLIANGKGLDLLVHAIASARPDLLKNMMWRLIIDHHTQPDQAATVFNRTQPKLAVFSHFVQMGTPAIPVVPVGEMVAETKKTWAGPLQAGEDLMSFEIGDSGVKVNDPPRK